MTTKRLLLALALAALAAILLPGPRAPEAQTARVPVTASSATHLTSTGRSLAVAASASAARSALSAVSTARTVAGLDLSADRSAADLLAALDAARVSALPLGSTSGWTETDFGDGECVFDTGAQSIAGVALNGEGAGANAGGDAYRTFPTVGPCFRMQGRYTVVADGSSDFLTYLGCNWNPGGDYLIAHVRGNGAMLVEYNGGAALDAALGLTLGGTGWVRLEVCGIRLRVYTGTGAGASEPTDWTLRYDGDRSFLTNLARPTRIFAGARTNSGHVAASDSTGTWHSLTVSDLSLD